MVLPVLELITATIMIYFFYLLGIKARRASDRRKLRNSSFRRSLEYLSSEEAHSLGIKDMQILMPLLKKEEK